MTTVIQERTAVRPSIQTADDITIGEMLPQQGPTYQAYQTLRFVFSVIPIIAGFDKFMDLLVNWDAYLSPVFARWAPLSPHAFMQVVGMIEILAGLVVALKPRFGSYLVAAWLGLIIINLLSFGGFYDIALRDFGLCLGAVALGRLSVSYDY